MPAKHDPYRATCKTSTSSSVEGALWGPFFQLKKVSSLFRIDLIGWRRLLKKTWAEKGVDWEVTR
jgi:hypothetical protein